MESLKKMYGWFRENRDAIIGGHIGEQVLIEQNSVKGYFDTEKEAFDYAIMHGMKYGNFLIQNCLSEEADMAYNYNQAVSFG